MKFCSHCGTQLLDEAVVCPNCGCAAEQATASAQAVNNETSSTLKLIAKIFMVLGCISTAFAFLIPLCWTIPMTVHYWKAVDNGQRVGTGFKVCALLFVNLVAGVLMLCDNQD